MSLTLKIAKPNVALNRLRFKVYDDTVLIHTTRYFEEDSSLWVVDDDLFISIDDYASESSLNLSVSILMENDTETAKSNVLPITTSAKKQYVLLFNDDYTFNLGTAIPAFSSNLVLNNDRLEVDRGSSYPCFAINYPFVIGKHYKLEVDVHSALSKVEASLTFNKFPKQVVYDFSKKIELTFRYGEASKNTYDCFIASPDSPGSKMIINEIKLYELQ